MAWHAPAARRDRETGRIGRDDREGADGGRDGGLSSATELVAEVRNGGVSGCPSLGDL